MRFRFMPSTRSARWSRRPSSRAAGSSPFSELTQVLYSDTDARLVSVRRATANGGGPNREAGGFDQTMNQSKRQRDCNSEILPLRDEAPLLAAIAWLGAIHALQFRPGGAAVARLCGRRPRLGLAHQHADPPAGPAGGRRDRPACLPARSVRRLRPRPGGRRPRHGSARAGGRGASFGRKKSNPAVVRREPVRGAAAL